MSALTPQPENAPAEEDDLGYRAITQLAGCLTAAEGHVDDDVKPGVYGYSLAYEKVALLRQAFDLLADGRSPQQVIDAAAAANGCWPGGEG